MSADYQATEKLSLNFGATYNYAEGYMDSISLTEPFPATPGLPLDLFYSDFEGRIGLVENYSDLEYTQIDLSMGGTYNFSDRLYATANVTYSDFDSGQEYVYGDESGSVYYGTVGVGYRF